MDIYTTWVPGPWTYAVHLLLWMLPVLFLQWAIGGRVLLRNWRTIVWPAFIVGTYLILTDMVAVAQGIWYFDENLILGFNPGGVPIEEWVFFYLTAVLVAQSLILFLPARYRR